MDYLRSAASAVLAKSTSPLQHYIIGPPVQAPSSSSRTIWQLHTGTKKDDGSPCSVFVFDVNSDHNSGRSKLTLARNALKKLRTLRHPDVLKLLDSAETPTAVYIAVEPIRHLQPVLDDWIRNGGTDEGKQEWISWGLSRVANALKFINADAGSVHGNVRPETVFLSQAGEWRLGGFELLTAKADVEGVLWSMGGLVPDGSAFVSPEVRQGGWTVLRDQEPSALDSYSFSLLAFAAFNGLVPGAGTSMPPQGSVPPPLFAALRRMMAPNPKSRMPIAALVESASAQGGFWKENRLTRLSESFENFMLATERERSEAIRSLQSSSSSLPVDFLSHRVLPSLVHALNLSSQPSTNPNGSTLSNSVHPASILPLVLQLGASLPASEWTISVLPPILNAYKSPDRSVRMMLLDSLTTYIDRIDAKKVSDAIWPNVITGFADSSAAIREGTLKAILPLAPKLTDRIRNNDLLRQLAKTQVDVEAPIRTNTTILLGRLAPSLNITTRKSVLIPAFSRSLKDPFVHARVAGLMALMATSESYDKDDLARGVLPAVCPALVDKEKLVRDQAERAMEMFWERIREEVKPMPESVLPPPTAEADGGFASNVNGATSFEGGAPKGSGPRGLASTAGGAASTLAGWAMSGAMNYFGDAPVGAVGGGGTLDSKRPTLLTGQSTSSGASTPMRETPSRSQSASPANTAAAAAALPSSFNLIDMDDDADDWTSFASGPSGSSSAKKAPPPVVRKGMPGRKTSALGASSTPREMSSTGAERLKMAQPVAAGDDAAWGDDSWSTAPSTTSKAAVAAFATPVPSWDPPRPEVTSAMKQVPAAAPSWSNDFPDYDDDAATKVAMPAASTDSGVPLSKEEKRAQMEKQREERRERMRKLKASKGQKLGDSLA